MCGICGKVDFDDAIVDRALVESMCARLVHRGPDDQGIHVGPGFGLGQRRLSIIDLSGHATAPLANEDGSIWVTFNGEIYNFRELRADLIGRGHQFRTATDTEVLVHLYEERGVDFVLDLHGMFSLALWDAPRKRLVAARDRLGKKPFYYAVRPDGLAFASEVQALLADPSIPVEPDYAALDAYLTYQYVPSPSTAFRGISKLAAGHRLVCEARTVQIDRYWAPPQATKVDRPVEELRGDLLARLRKAVRRRLVADVPLGALLSGGIDSGSIVALMAQETGTPVRTFSIGFEDAAFNELDYARLVARKYETDHHELVVRPDAATLLPDLVHHYGEPFADSSALPTYYVAKLAREHVTVALSGDGGDESFAGYDNYAAVAAWDKYDGLPFGLRRAVAKSVSGIVDHLPYTPALARASRAAQMWAGSVPERFRLQSTIFKPQERAAAYTREFRARVAGALPHAELTWDDRDNALDWMMRHDQHFYLPDCLMVKIDIASMAHSLEVRCPLLDHELVEFAATIPAELKRANGHGQGKRILRETVAGLLPPEVLTKRKSGFGVPLAQWLRGPLRDVLRDTLLDGRFSRRGLIAPDFVSSITAAHLDGRADMSARLWALLMLELWFREFID